MNFGEKIRHRFPIYSEIARKDMVYLDTGATSQRIDTVLEAMNQYHLEYNANIHRGVYPLSEQATFEYEGVRKKVSDLLHGEHGDVVFTKSATEACNLAARSYGGSVLQENDIILVSEMEHHANIVPWQMIAAEKGAKVLPIPVLSQGEIDLDAYKKLLEQRPKIVAITHVSNVLGTINPVEQMVRLAHEIGAVVVVDGSQAVHHVSIDLRRLDCDMYVFTGHKVYGPTGVGVLWGKKELLEVMPPYQGGGDMIESVSFDNTTFMPSPTKFEAGTPPIAAVIGLGAAMDFLKSVDYHSLHEHESILRLRLEQKMRDIKGIRILGQAKEKIAVTSFTMEGVHPHDIASVLASRGVYIRAGHHCAEPLMTRMGCTATSRFSMGIYTTESDVDRAVEALYYVQQLFLT